MRQEAKRRRRTSLAWSMLVLGLVTSITAGCAATPYQYGGSLHTQRDAYIAAGESQVQRGRPAPVVDTVGWAVGIPAKIVMLDHRVDNHHVSYKTESCLEEYLAANQLDRVKVRINQYDPVGEWTRLKANQSVSWPIRYTAGTVSWVGYTLLPGRVFGGDRYNPYTNTISIYSDVPAVALYQGARAKDYALRQHKGLYALAYSVPGVGLVWHDAHASQDVMGYLVENGTPDEVRAGYRSVLPTYALDASEPIAAATGVPLVLPAVVAGHVVGQCKAVCYHDKVPETHDPCAEEHTQPHVSIDSDVDESASPATGRVWHVE